jgi:2-polyprenyl-3-methyl-5-hydroxy-6-metoxy-1,4-benzoquinol methylase
MAGRCGDNGSHQEKVSRFFQRRAEIWDGIYETDSPFWRWFNRVFRKGVFLRAELTIQAAADNSCRSVLDVGCGSGRVSCLLARSGVEHVRGVDAAPEMIELAGELARRQGVADACEFTVGDFRAMDFPEPFDAVIALGVLEYIAEPAAFLRKIRLSARKFIFFSAPSPTLVRSPLRKLRYRLRGCPVHFYRRKRIEALMREAGFEHFRLQRATLDGYMVTGWVHPPVG